MALTVRPDDEVYQFDTVWLGPDEYTLPIQARYVAWGTWLACFLVSAVVLIPLGGGGPAGVLGSLIWALAVSVVLSRAVMLVVDHERPLRSLPALFGAEARAAVQGRRRTERSLLVRPGKVVVRETPAKVLAMRERQRGKVAAKADRKRTPVVVPEPVAAGVVAPVLHYSAAEWTPDDWVEPVQAPPAWSIPADVPYDSNETPYRPVPVPVASYPVSRSVPPPVVDVEPVPAGRHSAPEPARPAQPEPVRQEPARPARPVVPVVATVIETTPERPAPRPSPFREYPRQDEPYRVSPNGGRHAAAAARDDKPEPPRDRQAAVEARILLPARKDR